MNKSINDKIITFIKDRRITPRPRWQFVLQNSFFWFITAFLTILGGIAIATGIFILTDYDWDVFVYLDKGPLVSILQTLPYLWLGIFVMSIIIGRYSISHTRNGYRYRISARIISIVGISSMFGIALYSAGFGIVVHTTLMNQIPWYRSLVYTNDNTWYAPEHGLLSGNIQSLQEKRVLLKSLDGTIWTVTIIDQVREMQPLVPGLYIKIIGEKTGIYSFNAEDIEF